MTILAQIGEIYKNVKLKKVCLTQNNIWLPIVHLE